MVSSNTYLPGHVLEVHPAACSPAGVHVALLVPERGGGARLAVPQAAGRAARAGAARGARDDAATSLCARAAEVN